MDGDLLQEFTALHESVLKNSKSPDVLARFKSFEQVLLNSVLIDLTDTIQNLVVTAAVSFWSSDLVQVQLDNQMFPVYCSESTVQSIKVAVIHLLRNSVSHGQNPKGKTDLKVNFGFSEGEFGFFWKDQGNSLPQETELQSLFQNTTPKHVSLSSGRGVGILSSKRSLEKIGSDLKVFRTIQGGLGVFVVFPKVTLGFSGKIKDNVFHVFKRSEAQIEKKIFFPVSGKNLSITDGTIPWACVENGKLIFAKIPIESGPELIEVVS